MDYETFASLSPLKRSQMRLTPEETAEIIKTHWTRFLEANRERLNAEQIAFLEGSIGRVRPELYSEDRKRTEEEFKQNRELDARFMQLFPREDAMKLHMGAFKHSGEIRNPLARALVYRRYEKSDELDAAFVDMLRLPAGELRKERPDLPALLEIAEDEFWPFVDDEEVRLAAQRARAMTHTMRNPLALILWNSVPRKNDDDLAQALRELRDGQMRDDLRELLASYFDNVPADVVFDEDVRVAASKAHLLVREPWLREEMQRQRDRRR